jgi:hypothetical protein
MKTLTKNVFNSLSEIAVERGIIFLTMAFFTLEPPTTQASNPSFTDANWVSLGGFQGSSSGPIAMMVSDSKGDTYVGGDFEAVGNVLANNIAKWNGTNWSALGSGVSNSINGLAVDNVGNVYATDGYDRLLEWQGTNWSVLYHQTNGSGANVSPLGPLYCNNNGQLFGNTSKGMALWTGGSWSVLQHNNQATGGQIFAITSDGVGNLYVGGSISLAGGNLVTNLAMWDGTQWHNIGYTNLAVVQSLAVDNLNNLYVGSDFGNNSGVASGSIAVYGSGRWTFLPPILSPGFGNIASLICDHSGNLYAGGIFANAGGVAANQVAKWNGTAWSNLGSGVRTNESSYVQSLTIDTAGTLYAGGIFTGAGEVVANNIAKWDGSEWASLPSATGSTFNDGVSAVAFDKYGNLYAGGTFSTAGDGFANAIAVRSNGLWSALGSGLAYPNSSPSVSALIFDGSGNLFVGGQFLVAGGITCSNIAMWNGNAWLNVGFGVNSTIAALAVDGNGNLYAGGEFTVAGGVSANHVAKWDGTNWSALAGGLNSTVVTLAIDHSGNLYAGGTFTTANGVSANHIAKWDGTNWSALGSGVSSVSSLAFDGTGNIYVGGLFQKAGSINATNIVMWNGSSWFALGPGLNNIVSCILADGFGNVYAGGDFYAAGNIPVNHVAIWNGVNWFPLGSGTPISDPGISFLKFDPLGDLYAAGSFLIAGTNVSPSIAKALVSRASYNLALATRGGGSFTINAQGTPGYFYALDIATNLTSPIIWMPQLTNSASDKGLLEFTNASPTAQGFFRTRYVH